MKVERWKRWSGWSGGFWKLLLQGSRSSEEVTVSCCLGPGSAPSKQPLKAHGEWRDEAEEWGLNLSPPSLPHLLSPCQGTCQGHIYKERFLEIVDWQERHWHETRKRSFTDAFWKNSVQHTWLKTKMYKTQHLFSSFLKFCGLDFTWIGFTNVELNWSFPCVGLFQLWTLDLETQHFLPSLFLSTSNHSFQPSSIFSLCCLKFPQTSPPSVFINLPFALLFPTLPFFPSSIFISSRAKDMKNRLAFLRRRNESPGSNPASKLDKSMKSVK